MKFFVPKTRSSQLSNQNPLFCKPNKMATHWSSFLTLHIPSKNPALGSISKQSEPVGIINNVMWSCLYPFNMLKLVEPSSWLFPITMKPISAEKHSYVISLLKEGYPHCQIIAKTGVGMGTVNRINKEVNLEKENNPGGHPPKLSAHDKQSIIHQITSGKLDNAVQATQFINNVISDPVTPQTVRNALKESGLHSATKKKVLMLKKAHHQRHLSSVSIMKTGLWRTGRGCYSQMRQRLIKLDQMGRFMSGNNVENPYLTALQHQLSNMEVGITWWYGAVWVRMEWASS